MSLNLEMSTLSRPQSEVDTPDSSRHSRSMSTAVAQEIVETDVPVIFDETPGKQYSNVVVKLADTTVVADVIDKVIKEATLVNHKIVQNGSVSKGAAEHSDVGSENPIDSETKAKSPSTTSESKTQISDYELHCVYFSYGGHCFESFCLKNDYQTVLDQIYPFIQPYAPSRFNTIDDIIDNTVQYKQSTVSVSSAVSLPGRQQNNVFVLYVTWKNGVSPKLGDGRFMRTLVQQYSPSALSLPSSDQSDLCALPELNEKTLLYHIKGRFQKRKFYTYVGTILISVNPYWMDGTLYGVETMQRYQLQSSTTGTLSRGLEPHVFAVGDQAFLGMRESKQDQCIVISGESGSGKTVAANEIIRYLMQLTNQGDPSSLELMIAHTSPILEAFGNAKTDHNNNSSRHGKYIQIQYKQGGIVNGARVQKYLLEKSRIIQHKKNERNYHVFFYLLASDYTDEDEVCKSPYAWLKEMFSLTKASDYHYLNQSELTSNEHEDFENFLFLIQSMHELLGASGARYTDRHQKQGVVVSTLVNVFRVLAAILHLGNVKFVMPPSENLERDLVQIENEEHLKHFCDLLKLPLDDVKVTLQTRKHEGAAQFVKHNSIRDAESARDTVAKALYSSLFDWIIRQINFRMFCASMNESSYYQSAFSSSEERQIGILDIFGFEDIGSKNSFEQFCINFANEQLQFYFNDNIFNLEQKEYKSDGIDWVEIDYVNNKPCIDLFMKRPFCLFALIDEESSLYNGTNAKLLDKFEQLGNSKLPQSSYFKWRPIKSDPLSFGIKHYAGDVRYNISEFREKNQEKTNDLMRLMRFHTSDFFVKELCCQSPVGIAGWRTVRNVARVVSALSQISRGKLKDPAADNGISDEDAARRRKSMIPSQPKFMLVHQRSDSVELDPAFLNHHRESWSPHNFDPKLTKPVGHKKANRLRRIRDQPLYKVCWFYAQDPERINTRRISKNSYNCLTASLTVEHSIRKKSEDQEKWLTISSQFTGSLSQLMDSLNRCKPSFIRCIRSNTRKVELEFDEKTVTRQLKYTGMLDTIRIRSSGYNVRMHFNDFVKEYRVLLAHGTNSTRSDVEKLLSDIFPDPKSFQLGNRKVYLREKGHMQLQFFIELKLSIKIQTIQRWWRKILPRIVEKRRHKAAFTIQRSYTKYKHALKKERERCLDIIQSEQKLQRKLLIKEPNDDSDLSRMSRSCTFTPAPDDVRIKTTPVSRDRTPVKQETAPEPETNSAEALGESISKSKSPRHGLKLPTFSTVKNYLYGSNESLNDPGQTKRQSHTMTRENRHKPIKARSPVKPLHETPSRATFSTPTQPEPKLVSSPSYQMCQKCHTRTIVAPDGGDIKIIICNKCASPVVRPKKVSAQQEFNMICKTFPKDRLEKVVLKDAKEVNRFTQFLNTNMKLLSSNSSNDLMRTLTALKTELLMQCGQQTSFRPLKFFQVIKMFMDNYDRVAKNKPKDSNIVLPDPNHPVLDKPFLVRSFGSILTHFMNNQKLVVIKEGERPWRVNRRSTVKLREIQGHQLEEKRRSPLINCLCGKRKNQDFVQCVVCKCAIHKMCEHLLVQCPGVLKGDYPPHKFIRVPLETLYNQNNKQVPGKLCDLLAYIEDHGLNLQGIYRTNGSQMEKKRLINLLESEDYAKEKLEDFDVKTTADVVKLFFRSLPNCLFTNEKYKMLMMALDLETREEQTNRVFQHLKTLPPANSDTLQALIVHLLKVNENSAVNRMEIENIATVFVENLIFSNDPPGTMTCGDMLSATKKRSEILILILEKISRRVETTLKIFEELDNCQAEIDAKLAMIGGNDIQGETKPNVAVILDLQSAMSGFEEMRRLSRGESATTENNNEPLSQAEKELLASLTEKSDIEGGRGGGVSLLEHDDPTVLQQQSKVITKIREKLLQNMTRLDYDETEIYRNMGDDDNEDGFYLHSCSDKTQSLMIVDKRKSTRKRTSRHTSRRDSSDNQLSDNSEPLSGSVSSDSSDIAEEYSYKLASRLSDNTGEQRPISGQKSRSESFFYRNLQNYQGVQSDRRSHSRIAEDESDGTGQTPESPDCQSRDRNSSLAEANLTFVPNRIFQQLFQPNQQASSSVSSSARRRSMNK